MNTMVEIRNLTKRYRDLVAVNDISFEIERGEIFGLLGPNGAGKTTTVEMIEGLRKPDSGFIRVCGIDIPQGIDKVKEIMGLELQTTTIWDKIRIGEVIDLFGDYYHKRLPTDEVLEEVSLIDRKKSFVEELSGGQRKRLTLALALVNDPEILILDEPTSCGVYDFEQCRQRDFSETSQGEQGNPGWKQIYPSYHGSFLSS